MEAVRKLGTKCLNADQKSQRCHSSEQLLEIFRRNPNDLLSRLVTMDKTWLYRYEQETKQQSMVWRHSGSPRHPQKSSECKNPLEKFSPRFLGDQDDILLVHNLPKSQTINAEYYSSLLVQLKDILRKNACHGKVTKGVLFLTTVPRLTGHLQTRRNWPTWASTVLITQPILQIWPSRTTTCSLN